MHVADMAMRTMKGPPSQSRLQELSSETSTSPVQSHNSRPSADSFQQRDNPFKTPNYQSKNTSSNALDEKAPRQRYFQSRRIKDKKEIEKPWLTDKKDPRKKWLTIVPLIGFGLGLAIGAFFVYQGLSTMNKHNYCPVYIEDWSSGQLDPKIWTKEVEVGGYGNGQFEETTGTDENVFIEGGMLHIKPTLQDPALLKDGASLNLTALGSCTSNQLNNCFASTNTTNGTIVNPVKSARINTKKGANIKFGRVEVEALLPSGDWMWPAIWLMPTNSKYGAWPASGEIDIAESRGNNHTYPLGGNNIIGSTLHWGPDQSQDHWYKTFGVKSALHTTFAETWHTFGLEWSEKYLYTYINGRLLQVLYVTFDEPFWKRGNFPVASSNGTAYLDIWDQTGSDATPFDEDFYLILDVAVGGTNGWFKDGKAGKPWVDDSPTAARDFYEAKDQWYPTWQKNGEMLVRSVKMWQQSGYNGCN